MENMNLVNPKVVELSFRILEKIIMVSKFTTKEDILNLTKEMRDTANAGDYPEEIKQAYEEAINKINSLSVEQLRELHDIICD